MSYQYTEPGHAVIGHLLVRKATIEVGTPFSRGDAKDFNELIQRLVMAGVRGEVDVRAYNYGTIETAMQAEELIRAARNIVDFVEETQELHNLPRVR